jgi:hypothetical protein
MFLLSNFIKEFETVLLVIQLKDLLDYFFLIIDESEVLFT